MTIKVLVTGTGGGCGMAICAALRRSDLDLEIHAADITPFAAGVHLFDHGVVLPKPEEDIDAWEIYVAEHGIQVVFPGSDHDLPSLARVSEKWNRRYYCEVMVSDLDAVQIANDKARTVGALSDFEVSVPKVYLDFQDVYQRATYPLIVKPRFGMTSRGVQIVHNRDELTFYWKHTDLPIVQEYIEGDEYTCALTYDKTHELRSWIVLKRELYMGSTHIAIHDSYPLVEAFCEDFARKTRKLNFSHALNVQLRVRDGVCYVFELNARCSGSTAIRAQFGYNQPAQLIKHHILRQPIFQPPFLKRGIIITCPTAFLLEDLSEAALRSHTGVIDRIPS